MHELALEKELSQDGRFPTPGPTMRVLIGLLVIASALGWPTFNDLIPNGDKVPNPCNPSLIWNGVGHLGPYGSGPRNQFGHDFIKAGKVGKYPHEAI